VLERDPGTGEDLLGGLDRAPEMRGDLGDREVVDGRKTSAAR
jgi:hypothetical protein